MPASEATGITGDNITNNGGVLELDATNSFSLSGWDTPGVYIALGSTVASGYKAEISSLMLSTRSSATGPGSMDLLLSVDGGAFTTFQTIVQPGVECGDEDLTFAPIDVKSSAVFKFMVTPGATATNGGAIGPVGTFRVADFFDGKEFFPITIDGSVTRAPEPSTWAMTLLGFAGRGFAGYRASRKANIAVA